MASIPNAMIQNQLETRRERLQGAIALAPNPAYLEGLLDEVDAALGRMGDGSYGKCEVCHDPIEPDRLMADPLVRLCIDHLTAEQQRALEQDLELAARIQSGLLPPRDQRHGPWRLAFHYEPAGPVSGDYCDVVPSPGGGPVHFLLGDVTGKGVAASMLMSNLQAMFRTLVPLGLPLHEMAARASRLFCESTLPTHYATVVLGKASPSGEVEICNAGHLPPLLLAPSGVSRLGSTGLPVGLFCEQEFSIQTLSLAAGDALLLYTDGVTEARNVQGEEFGLDSLKAWAEENRRLDPASLVKACRDRVRAYCSGSPPHDDLTVMAVSRVE